ncbi:MAG: tetratricopeptide repeat protein [Candidatus Sulfobium sp.]
MRPGKRNQQVPARKWSRGDSIDGRHAVALILLLSAIFLAYSSSLHGTWALDDVVARRPVGMHDIHDLLGTRKVAFLTFLLNQHIGRFTPFNFRVFNIILHFLNTVLVYALAYKTILLLSANAGLNHYAVDRGGNRKNLAFFAAFASGAIFALHPLNINAVAYIVQRMASLAAFFVLLSLLSYIAANSSRSRTGAAFFYGLSAAFIIIGVFSKENAVMAVPLILLYDYVFISRSDGRLFWKKMLVVLAVATASVGIAAYYLGLYSRFAELMRIFVSFDKPIPVMSWTATDVYWTPLQHVLTEFRVVSRYIFRMFVPLPRFLVFDWWGYPISHGLTQPLTTLFSAVFILSLLAFSVCKIKRFPLLSFGILWYFVAISLESFLALGSDLYFEYRNYLPLAGLVIGIAGQILVSFRPKERVVWGVVLALCLALGSLTYARNLVWKDSITLWTDTVQKEPSNIRAMQSLGNAYLKAADTENAEKCYERVMKMSGENRRVHFFNDAAYSLGMIYLFRGELPKAKRLINEFSSMVESYKPEILRAFYNSLTGNVDEAIRQYDKVLPEAKGSSTDTVVLYTLLGDAYRAKGAADIAIVNYEKALSIDPGFASAYYGMGVAYMTKRDVPLAYDYFSKTLQLDPDNTLALSDMADLLLVRGSKPEDALAYARRAVTNSPFMYQPYLTMANVLTVMGREEKAAGFYDEALKHGMPGYMVPFNKARAYFLKGDKEKASHYISELRKFRNLPENIRSIIRN